MEKIIIQHSGDLHSHLDNWCKVRRFLQEGKKAENEQTTVVTVDLGDFVDRWHPLTEATDAKQSIELMNEAGYDAVTIGNNEGIGNPKFVLDHLYEQANFDVLLGNLLDGETLEPPTWRKDEKILVTNSGTKIGLFAFTAPFPLTYEPNGWKILNPEEMMNEWVERIRPKVDVLILMSHLGVNADKRIAQKFPEIDVILGSHTHHLFENGKLENGVLLTGAGKFGQYVGKVTLLLEEKKIVSKEAHTYKTAEMREIATDEKEILGYMNKGHALLQEEKIANLPFDLTNQAEDNFPLTQMTLNAVANFANTEASILNTGLLQTDLPKGIVNMDELHRTLPHPMHILRVTLDGENFRRMIYEMEKNRSFLRPFAVVGMGFRGKIFGELVYQNIFFDKETREVYYCGKKVENDQNYTFATVDHLMFLPFFPTIELYSEHEFLFPEFIRTVLAKHLSKTFPLEENAV
ncbi:2',3'-cyclic-nucleotide 2'-phosphodiesterase/5'-or 3'-nucleotidase, 5'-nucleotidase family [Pilibacter termitis]|uniref:2',3'-cyclic-nucleotide 2'-phosphodiesterase/5'-or 3'-nucleotidase, 5'-nucleotidase family n=1 Tax=Pilibacter termitis TaxID=263852 RepID=A0A1T4LGB3_9ENTE|nr:bifunctional UDP-sugar hydrolase/5'-nucleotidase [Pilibacter termitis]SJZ53618.1 2',3'-cyclic-nucleotide 2'-phosphodiesterase/5'-or 3'-nucleotidase, 5'-nucleotidase family [Pilibacter termitis]